MNSAKKQMFNGLGWIFFGLGTIGAFLPLLPTTPFILLAAYFFSKGSPRIYNWLINLKYFGPRIKDWNQHGAIDTKSKIIASILMAVILGTFMWATAYELWLKWALALVLTSVAIFINTRPSRTQVSQKVESYSNSGSAY